MKNISLWQYAGFAITSLLGSLLHFVYDWTGKSVIAAPFSAVNESTWEHMKLLFFPMFVFAIIESFSFKDCKSFWCIKFIGIVAGLVLIPTLFYTVNGAFGKTPDLINIAIFFVSSAISFILETAIFKSGIIKCPYPIFAFLNFVAITLLFVIFTFLPVYLRLI